MNLRRKPDHTTLLSTYLDELLSYGASAATIRAYRTGVKQWVASGEDAKQWLEGLAGSPKTKNVRRQQVSAYHKWLVANGHAKTNPLEGSRKFKEPTRLRSHLTIRQVSELIAACSALGSERDDRGTVAFGHISKESHRARVAAMIGFQVQTGVRVAELCGLRADRLDRDSRIASVIGKGDKERPVVWGEVADELLQAWMTRRAYEGIAASAYVFCTSNLTPVLPRSYQKEFAEAARWAGLEGVTPHTLRHTFATLRLEAGTPIHDVQAMLGHSSVTTTEIYLHRNPIGAWKGSSILD